MQLSSIIFVLFFTASLWTDVSYNASAPSELSSLQSNFEEIPQSGQLYRIPITKTGAYKLTGLWIKEQISQDRTLNSDEINIYAIPGGPLRHNTSFDQTERPVAIPLKIRDGGDGRIDDADEIFFYVESSDVTRYHLESEETIFIKNPYSEEAYVILALEDPNEAVRITSSEKIEPGTKEVSSYLYTSIYHEDRVNLLDQFAQTQGSGQKWFGDELSNVRSFEFSDKLHFPKGGLAQAKVSASFAGRSEALETIEMVGKGESSSRRFTPTNTSDIEALYARTISLSLEVDDVNEDDLMQINFIKSDINAKLWLDEIMLTGTTEASFIKDALPINNYLYLDESSSVTFNIDNESSQSLEIWEITDPLKPQILDSGGPGTFSMAVDQPRNYVVFNEAFAITPSTAAPITYNEIKALEGVSFIIITTDVFLAEANRLKAHREEKDQLRTSVILLQDIYDQYSAGRQDPTAIRNYVRELYRNQSEFQYLLFLGDASFDFRYLNKSHPRNHVVPTFETFDSTDPLLSFPSDDYFALLDDDEDGSLIGDLDIAIGRITVTNPIEAEQVIEKIISYDEQLNSDKNWKAKTVYLADDEDNNLHINDADLIASNVAKEHPLFNQEKIYFDAFQQESTPGGNRYPAATAKLNQTIEEGALVVNYLGHGGPGGWGQERVLKVDDINSWTNKNRLPLIITATCSFTGFDDPAITSAGEAALLNPNGGAVSLFTTVRSVFASKNFQLTRSVFDFIFEKEDGQFLRIGEVMRRAKNQNVRDNTNARKFFLIGDPTLRLSIPERDITIEKINNQSLEEVVGLNYSALDEIKIDGEVGLANVVDASFNGTVDVIVYDKAEDVQTLKNDARSFIKRFKEQQNIIYKGRTAVKDGQFSFSFVVPLDINYSVGNTKISLSAVSNNGIEALGFSEALQVGGTAFDPIEDITPPEIDVYINSTSFEDGQVVAPDHAVIIDLRDDSGINLSSAGIGHEVTATWDGDSKTTIFLNDLYSGSISDANAGQIIFDVTDLEAGFHSLTVKAFDVANNAVEKTITFVVDNEIERKVTDISIQPNPFHDETDIVIQHDLSDGPMNVEIEVFDGQGRSIAIEKELVISANGVVRYNWAPETLSQGIFFLRATLISGTSEKRSSSLTKKAVLLK